MRENEIYLTKEVKDFCNENIKTTKKEIRKDTRWWGDTHAPGLAKVILWTCLYHQSLFIDMM